MVRRAEAELEEVSWLWMEWLEVAVRSEADGSAGLRSEIRLVRRAKFRFSLGSDVAGDEGGRWNARHGTPMCSNPTDEERERERERERTASGEEAVAGRAVSAVVVQRPETPTE